MKKSSFVTLLFGTISSVLFALGMCMTLLPEWNAFNKGVILGAIGLVLGLITLIIWFKMEKKKLPKINRKTFLKILYIILSCLVLGVGMCLCLVWNNFVYGIIIGLVGIVMLLGLIPMLKGLK
jgi:hypothetical protein